MVFKNFILIIFLITITVIGRAEDSSKQKRISEFEKNSSPRIGFTENKGQISDQYYAPRPDVLFSAAFSGMTCHLKNKGISYQLYDIKPGETNENIIYRLDINWIGINENPNITTARALNGYNNYYLQSCPNGATQVKSYEGVFYNNIYDRILLHYYTKDEALKYDYIIAPGGDYKQIQFEIIGASDIRIDKDGSLLLKTPLGTIREEAPIVYQNDKQLKACWIIRNDQISFEIKNYDPKMELIIDPGVRSWGTYYGGSSSDMSHSCVTDLQGNVYLSGDTQSSLSSGAIATTGAHQTLFGGGAISDAFLVKFNATGTRLWGTYYGGGGHENGYCCATDLNNNVYMVGAASNYTTSIIATPGSYLTTISAVSAAFLVKFNSNGIRQWGTYFPGTAYSCITDIKGNLYFAGTAGDMTGITTATSHQMTNSGNGDAFLAKFDTSGNFSWATYYGGTLRETGYSCTADTAGNIYLSGESASSNAIATSGSYQTIWAGGYSDAFLVKFNKNGVRQWGTYFGGAASDIAYSCSADIGGNIYISGATSSSISIATPGSHQSVYNAAGDGFLAKFDSNGMRQWSTYIGSWCGEDVQCCYADDFGNVYVSGWTCSNYASTIVTPDAPQPNLMGSSSNAFLVKFNSLGVRDWGTYYGTSVPSNVLQAYCCTADKNGNAFLVGVTNFSHGSSVGVNIIESYPCHQCNLGGPSGSGTDAFLVKFCNGPKAPLNMTSLANSKVCYNTQANLSVSNSGTIGWYSASFGGVYLGNGNTFTTPPLTTNTTYYVQDSSSCSISSRTAITVTVLPQIFVSVSSQTNISCNGGNDGSATINATNGTLPYTYSWSPSGGNTTTAVGLTAGMYTCMVLDSNLCINTQTVIIEEPSVMTASLSTLINVSCFGSNDGSATLGVSGASGIVSYSWSPGSQISQTATNLSAGSYTCYITDGLSCAIKTIEVTQPLLINSSQSVTLCAGQQLNIGMSTYTTNGSYTNTLTATNGCDSIVNTSLIILPLVLSSSSYTLCSGQAITVGMSTYSITGNYTNTLSATNGCDSIVNTDIIIENPLDVTTNMSGLTITANAVGVNYQWMDCGTNLPIIGEQSQSFIANTNGDYAVIVYSGACSDTSSCVSITSTRLSEYLKQEQIKIYPNPNNGSFSVKSNNDIILELKDNIGRCLQILVLGRENNNKVQVDVSAGIYFLCEKDKPQGFRQKIIILQ